MSMTAIVCEDVSRKLNEGTVVEGMQEVASLKRRGVVLLPFDYELPALANVGYVQRHFGRGWDFDRNCGERGCPMMLHITETCNCIYWAARVRRIRQGEPLNGQLRLVHTSSNQRGLGYGMRQIEPVLTLPTIFNEFDSAYVYGKTGFNVTNDGQLFVELYAVATNLRVEWVAITQHSQDYQWSANG